MRATLTFVASDLYSLGRPDVGSLDSPGLSDVEACRVRRVRIEMSCGAKGAPFPRR